MPWVLPKRTLTERHSGALGPLKPAPEDLTGPKVAPKADLLVPWVLKTPPGALTGSKAAQRAHLLVPRVLSKRPLKT